MSETVRELVGKLKDESGWPDVDILEAIYNQGGEAVGPLMEFVDGELDRLGRPPDERDEDDPFGEDDGDPLHFAIKLLLSIRDPATFPALLKLFLAVDEDALEDFESDLGNFGPIAIAPMLQVARDSSRPTYTRNLAASAALRAGIGDPEHREGVIDALHEIFDEAALHAELHGADDTEFLTLILCDLCDAADPRSRARIDEAFAKGLVDKTIIDEKSADSSFDGRAPIARIPEPLHWLSFYRRNYDSMMGEAQGVLDALGPLDFPVDDDDDEYGLPRPDIPVETIQYERGKIGRNDPCWCGSGKKFKKCHLKEEQE